jgi:2-methylcitrate dehydratase PrpD
MNAVLQPAGDGGLSISQRLAAHAAAFELEAAPADVIEAAKLCILDALGIGLASQVWRRWLARASTSSSARTGVTGLATRRC